MFGLTQSSRASEGGGCLFSGEMANPSASALGRFFCMENGKEEHILVSRAAAELLQPVAFGFWKTLSCGVARPWEISISNV